MIRWCVSLCLLIHCVSGLGPNPHVTLTAPGAHCLGSCRVRHEPPLSGCDIPPPQVAVCTCKDDPRQSTYEQLYAYGDAVQHWKRQCREEHLSDKELFCLYTGICQAQ
jgi:hypothetical protein